MQFFVPFLDDNCRRESTSVACFGEATLEKNANCTEILSQNGGCPDNEGFRLCLKHVRTCLNHATECSVQVCDSHRT